MKKIRLRVIGAVAMIGVVVAVLCAGCMTETGNEADNQGGEAADFLREYKEKAE
jgi:hypothetical protein